MSHFAMVFDDQNFACVLLFPVIFYGLGLKLILSANLNFCHSINFPSFFALNIVNFLLFCYLYCRCINMLCVSVLTCLSIAAKR